MKNLAIEVLKVAKYVLSDKRVSFRYQDVGHGEGAVIWWIGSDGKIKTHKSTGREYHHELDRKLDMDARWRGRLEPTSGRATLLPPTRLYLKQPDEIPLPGGIMRELEGMGAKVMFMDTQDGMRRVARKK